MPLLIAGSQVVSPVISQPITGHAIKQEFPDRRPIVEAQRAEAQRIENERLAAVEAARATAEAAAAQQTAIAAQTPITAPAVVSGANQDVQAIIVAAAAEFGVPAEQLLRIARCESTFSPSASNGTHFGVFQFLPSTYAANAPRAGAGSDYWDATNNIRTAAYMFSIGQSGQWVCK